MSHRHPSAIQVPTELAVAATAAVILPVRARAETHQAWRHNLVSTLLWL